MQIDLFHKSNFQSLVNKIYFKISKPDKTYFLKFKPEDFSHSSVNLNSTLGHTDLI